MKNIFKNEKAMLFVGGVLAGTVGIKALKSKTAKKFCVSTLANGMKVQQEAQALFQTMKEDAQDMCYEACEENKKSKNSDKE